MAKRAPRKATSAPTGIWAKVGVWSYVAGLVIALIVSIFSGAEGLVPWSIGTLAILGLIVGIVNIAESEVKLFLLATIAFILSAGAMSSVFSVLGAGFQALETFMYAIIVFTAPGALVVSFKALYVVAKDE